MTVNMRYKHFRVRIVSPADRRNCNQQYANDIYCIILDLAVQDEIVCRETSLVKQKSVAAILNNL